MYPLIRLIVVNYNGGDMTIRCLRNLSNLGWPADRVELVMVDNHSSDGVADRLASEMPHVRVVRSSRNLGFSGGANLGIDALGGVEFVGFVNNDAFPEADWLRPLVDAMHEDRSIGAAAPKILLAPRFVSLQIESDTRRPGVHDPRDLGVMVTGLRVDGVDRFADAVFRNGFWGPERGEDGPFQWTNGRAELWCPFDAVHAMVGEVEVCLRSGFETEVRLVCGDAASIVQTDARSTWHAIRPAGEPFDAINNVGSRLVAGGWAGDRGYLERDEGQYAAIEEVFAWCGAAALLSRTYLDDVGHFDARLFLYYEDTDLSWRGRLRGWRYVYVPASRVRHIHSATSGEGSALFTHYVDRNRLLVFLRNAPMSMAVDAARTYLAETVRIAARDVVRPVARRQPAQPLRTRQKLRSFAGYLRRAPQVVGGRARDRRKLKVTPRAVAVWAESP
ncbi:MAG TPA: glycosyltransferase family 2 protein [Acidimicrobiales bacterium]|nr:glycosyltransferase family 2 protein [Acidimicrobiales bacterium]